MPGATPADVIVSRSAPIPVYTSDRLVGIELEFDAGSMTFRLPSLPNGWSSKTDGSLRNGREVVLSEPVKLSLLMPYLRKLQHRVQSANTGINHLGGFHVHIGGRGWNSHSAYRVARLYTRYQCVIDGLVGNTRVNNRFAQPYTTSRLSEQSLIDQYHLNEPANTREDAKRTRSYSVVNVAAVRCRNELMRSVEFRQGSMTRRATNIWGWVCFLMSLVDMSHDGMTTFYDDAIERFDPTLNGLIGLLNEFEAVRGVDKVAAWVNWRYNHMHSLPEDYNCLKNKLVALCMAKPRGFVTISNALSLAYPQTKLLLQRAIADHSVIQLDDGSRRISAEYTEAKAKADLDYMLRSKIS